MAASRHHRGRGEQQLLDQLLRLVVGGGAVVAGFGHLHGLGDEGVVQLGHTGHDAVGHVDGVLARLLGDGQGDGGVLARRGRLGACALPDHAVPHQAGGRRRAIAQLGHIAQKHRVPLAHGHHQIGHLAGAGQIRAGFERQGPVALQQIAQGRALVGALQGAAQVVHGDAQGGQPGRVQLHLHGMARAAQGAHLARAGHALELQLQAVGHALEVVGTDGGVGAVQGQADDGHIIDALGFDQGFDHAQARGQPVAVAAHGVVQAHQGLGARHAHLELHGDHGQARARHRADMLGACHLGQHLLGRRGHPLLDIGHAGTREGNQHIGHGDVDLGLFLTRGDQHGEQAQQQRHQSQQGRDLGALEQRDGAACQTQAGGVWGGAVHVSAPGPQPGGQGRRLRPRAGRSAPPPDRRGFRPGAPGAAPGGPRP